VRGYLTRRSNGLYLLTYLEPIICAVGNTDRMDAYAQPGDPFALNNLCSWSITALWGVDLETLQTLRIRQTGTAEGDPYRITPVDGPIQAAQKRRRERQNNDQRKTE